MFQEVINLVKKAEQSGMLSGKSKKTWVMERVNLQASEMSFTMCAELIDLVVQLAMDPDLHAIFKPVKTCCLERILSVI